MASCRPLRLSSLLVLIAVVSASLAGAQTAPGRARLLVTVLDQTGAVLPGAGVVVAGQDEALAAVQKDLRTSGVGIAVAEDLAPGRYTVRIEFPGFQTTLVRDVRVRAGDNRRAITLTLKKIDQDVTVTRDLQSTAMDPRGAAFSTILTREQIESLPDDPDEMEAVLKGMAPPGSTIRVDGFTGGRLPPKSQIRSIRLPRLDMFAAQNHGGMSGALFIDIMTMPGAGPMRGSVDFSFLDDALEARNPMTPTKPEEQLRQGNFALSGTITPNKTSFSISAGVTSQNLASNVFAVLPDGSTLAGSYQQPLDRWNLSARIDHVFRKDHAVRLSFDRTSANQRNLGVGDVNLVERGYSSTAATNIVRLSENGPLGRRFFTESRLQVRWSDTAFASNSEAVALLVNGAFTSGGAQMRGGRRDVTFEAASDLDYVRGNHSWRTGVLFEGGRYTSDDTSNYLGTYTFADLASFNAGTAAQFTRRLGDPFAQYAQVQAAAYVQDDWRAMRSLLLSFGVRYGVETSVPDAWNLSPRVSAAWSPRRNGSLTFRASYGYFYDWISTDTYKQTLLVDGHHLREVSIADPSYPDPGSLSARPTPPDGGADQPVLVVGRHLPAERTPAQRGRGPGADAELEADGGVLGRLWRGPAPLSRHQRPGGGGAPGPGIRRRVRAGLRRRLTFARAECRLEPQQDELAPAASVRQLHARDQPDQHERRVLDADDRRQPRRRLGPVERRRAAPARRDDQRPAGRQPHRGPQHQRPIRAALQHHDRSRRQQ
jgi:hypothetical protein